MESAPISWTVGRVLALLAAVGAVTAFVVWMQSRSNPPAPTTPDHVAGVPVPGATTTAPAVSPEAAATPAPEPAPSLVAAPTAPGAAPLEPIPEGKFDPSALKVILPPPRVPSAQAPPISPEPKVKPRLHFATSKAGEAPLIDVGDDGPADGETAPTPPAPKPKIYFSTSKAAMAPVLDDDEAAPPQLKLAPLVPPQPQQQGSVPDAR